MTHDYGPYKPAPPTAKVLAIRDRLADELAQSATDDARAAAERSLVDHMIDERLPLEDFSTRSGRAFEVKVSVSVPKPLQGRERDAQRWLAAQGGSARTIAHRLVERGGVFPADLFKPTRPVVHVNAVSKNGRSS